MRIQHCRNSVKWQHAHVFNVYIRRSRFARAPMSISSHILIVRRELGKQVRIESRNKHPFLDAIGKRGGNRGLSRRYTLQKHYLTKDNYTFL